MSWRQCTRQRYLSGGHPQNTCWPPEDVSPSKLPLILATLRSFNEKRGSTGRVSQPRGRLEGRTPRALHPNRSFKNAYAVRLLEGKPRRACRKRSDTQGREVVLYYLYPFIDVPRIDRDMYVYMVVATSNDTDVKALGYRVIGEKLKTREMSLR